MLGARLVLPIALSFSAGLVAADAEVVLVVIVAAAVAVASCRSLGAARLTLGMGCLFGAECAKTGVFC